MNNIKKENRYLTFYQPNMETTFFPVEDIEFVTLHSDLRVDIKTKHNGTLICNELDLGTSLYINNVKGLGHFKPILDLIAKDGAESCL